MNHKVPNNKKRRLLTKGTTVATIPVIVVESHQHVLEHIHVLLRKKRGCLNGWTLLHWDSHADLACPRTIPARSCFRPFDNDINNLYTALDQRASGISEWITPLVLAGQLKRVHWNRPVSNNSSWSALPLGRHVYNVGVCLEASYNSSIKNGQDDESSTAILHSFTDLPFTSDAAVKVDWPHPYYLQDNEYRPTNLLQLRQELCLIVSEGGDLDESTRAIDSDNDASPWILDICLDYFVCNNPFLTDLDEHHPCFSQVLVEVASQLTAEYQTNASPDWFKREFTQWLIEMKILLNSLVAESSPPRSVSQTSLIAWKRLHDTLRHCSIDERKTIVDLAQTALPHLWLPHDPHQTSFSTQQLMTQRLQTFQESLEQSTRCRPFLITISRSTNDGFTNAKVVEELQTAILRILHQHYCGCERPCVAPDAMNAATVEEACRLCTVFDYGAWEGSTLQ